MAVPIAIAIAVRGWRGGLQPADSRVFVLPAVETRDQIAPELNDSGVRSNAPLNFTQFVAGLGSLAFLEELLRGKHDTGIAFVESGSWLDLNLHLHAADFPAKDAD